MDRWPILREMIPVKEAKRGKRARRVKRQGPAGRRPGE
jgi:hypothetical protein